MGNSPRDRGPGGKWLGFILSVGELSMVGSCPRTPVGSYNNKYCSNSCSRTPPVGT